MEQMKTFTVGADTWEIVDGAAREELADARTGADGTEYESAGEAMRESVNSINDDLEANYAMQDGYYEMLTAGSADNLTGRGDGVGAEYIYRTSGGSADVADGVARINSIHGNTLVFNQLISENVIYTGDSQGISRVKNGLKVTVYGTFDNDNKNRTGIASVANLVAGHKYYVAAKNMTFGETNNSGIAITDRYTQVADFANGGVQAAIITLVNDSIGFNTYSSQTTRTYDISFIPQIFDLTRMFGAGNEPATVEEFEALFPASYYAYDAGSLLNVNMQGVRTVGFNQWDEEWERGQFDGNGVPTANDNVIRSKNFIPVFGNTSYYFNTAGQTAYICQYDENKNFIGTRTSVSNQVFTTLSNARFIKFNLSSGYGTTYNNDICINLSWSGYRNGEYEPYWTQTRDIDTAAYFPDGMKSAGSVYDEMTAAKAVKRVGVVDMGTLTWYYVSNTTRFYALLNTATMPVNGNVKANILLSAYSAIPWFTLSDVSDNMVCAGLHDGTNAFVTIRNTAYTNPAELKAAMSGVMLYYELAEPVETEITPELNFTYKVSDFGTEEIVVADGEQTAPVCMQIVYGLNAVDTIRRLPVEYISHKSFMQFISAIESHFNVTITETYDSDNERYNYSIATNESGE